MHKTALASGQLLRSVHMEKSYLSRAVTRCHTTGNASLEDANSNRHQTVDQGKVKSEVTDLPWVKQLPWVHVISPLERFHFNFLLFYLLWENC